jgi:hypothetical protein
VTYAVTDPDNSSNGPGGTVPDSGTYDMVELAQIGTDINTSTATWSGCIEERDTVNTITSASGYAIPSGAYDLQANYVPDNDLTRWRPMWRSITYRRSSGTAAQSSSTAYMNSAACPAAARRLQAWTRANLVTYVNGLNPTGNTYHDTGMIWGTRLMSNTGPFPDSPDTFASMPVQRHIIFMTDGVMDTDRQIYGMYGIEQNSQRISGMSSPSEDELNGRHMQRFKMMCNAAKAANTSIWVIAFGSTLQPHLLECASSANQASVASDQAQLIARFREIGSNIGALRLTN